MKYILVIIFILNLIEIPAIAKSKQLAHPAQRNQASVGTSGPSKVKKDFLNTTKLKLGQYELIEDADPDCLQGELQVIDLTDRVTLMLGPKPVAQAIGKSKFEERERSCIMTYDTIYNENEINEIREKKCTNDNEAIKTVVKLSKGKLSYSRIMTINGKVVSDYSCNLRLVGNI